MIKKKKWLSVLVLAITLWMPACRVTRPYARPNVNTARLYRDADSTDTATIATLPYTQIFTDPVLQGLIAEGIRRNPDLLVAYTRIQQSQASYAQSRAAFFPSLNGNTGVT